MRLDADDQVQVTGGCAGQTWLAFTRDTHAQTFGGAGRDFDLDVAGLGSLHVAHGERALGAGEGFLEGDLDGLLDVCAFARRAADAGAPASGSAEHLNERAARTCRPGTSLHATP